MSFDVSKTTRIFLSRPECWRNPVILRVVFGLLTAGRLGDNEMVIEIFSLPD